MKTVETLKLTPVWVDPNHLASTARILMSGHRTRTLAVLEGGRLVGLVHADALAQASDDAPVRDFMVLPSLVVESGTPIREVADQLVHHEIDAVPVVEEGRFLGVVNAMMLLGELSRSWDPLTGLSWSDLLREWGVENLKRGREVTILFFDLDNFGQYNKRYGHIVGDRVLRKFAQVLLESVDPEKDVLVRYGGDEFAVGTLRTRAEAQGLAETIRRRIDELAMPDSDEPIQFCVGVFGGKRTRERENVHFAATLDNLINYASRECLSQKQREPVQEDVQSGSGEAPAETPLAEPVQPPPPPIVVPPIAVIGVHVDEQAPGSLTQVILNVGEDVFSGVSARTGRSLLESVAIATGKALERGFPGHAVRVEEIRMAEGPERQRLVSVAGQLSDGTRTLPIDGVAKVDQDLYSSVANATVNAFSTAMAGGS
jgi:IMP dehydrogenase